MIGFMLVSWWFHVPIGNELTNRLGLASKIQAPSRPSPSLALALRSLVPGHDIVVEHAPEYPHGQTPPQDLQRPIDLYAHAFHLAAKHTAYVMRLRHQVCVFVLLSTEDGTKN